MPLDRSQSTTMVTLDVAGALLDDVLATLGAAGYQTLTDAPGPQVLLSPERKGLLFLRVLETAPTEAGSAEYAMPPAHQVLLTLQTITAQLHSCPSLEVTAQFILEELLMLTGARQGWITLDGADGLRRLAQHDGGEETWAHAAPWCQLAAEHCRPILENAPAEEHTIALVENILALPLTHHGRLLGVLLLANRAGGFSEQWLPYLETLCFPLILRLAHGLQHADTLSSSLLPEHLDSNIAESAPPAATVEQAKEGFICLVSHELQSPLTVIKGYTEQLRWALAHQRACALDEGLAVIERQVQRMQRLIRDMLDLSALEMDYLPLEQQPTDLSALLTHIRHDLSVAHQRTIEMQVPPAVILLCDPHRIEQVVRNLVENAIKYSPTLAPVTLTLTEHAQQVELAVRDYGEGIEAEELPALFTPFYRTHAARRNRATGGQGLGLALCRELVERHGGTISVESTPGAGTTFIVVLPRR